MQRDAFDAQAVAALLELGRPVARPHSLEMREQKAGARTAAKNTFDFRAKMDERQAAGLLSGVTNHDVLPVDLLGPLFKSCSQNHLTAFCPPVIVLEQQLNNATK